MFIEERHMEIAELIEKNGKILVAEITERYGISDESARRDLRILEKNGLCKRTHGGAIKATQVAIRPPKDRDFQKMPIFNNYKAIARDAITRIQEDDVVYLTSGSFGHIILTLLPKDVHYTIVVNSVDLAQELRTWEKVDVYIVGGKMRQSGSVVDSIAVDFINRMHFDICFIAGAGLTAAFGLSNGTDETATFQRAVIRNSRKRVLLMPSAKVGKDAFVKVCNADAFDVVITDEDCAEDHISSLEEKGIKVVVVEAE